MAIISTNVAMVGAGPIGLELAVALKKAGIDYLHFEKGQIGQTISWFPRLMRFFSSPDRIAIAGVPIPRVDESKCTREEYLAYLRTIVTQFNLEIRNYETVVSLEKQADHSFIIYTRTFGEEKQYRARKVAFVTGDMHEPRLLGIPGEDLPVVSHYFDEPHKYFRKRVMVIGGKNSAVEAALRCHQCGAKVTISYRRSEFDRDKIKFWLLPEMKSLLKRNEIKFYGETVPREIKYGSVKLERISTGDIFEVESDFVLILTGYIADMRLLLNAGILLEGDNGKPVFNENTMESNVPGIFVAGTACAGSQQSFSLFIENCHLHVDRIVAALTGGSAPVVARKFDQPES